MSMKYVYFDIECASNIDGKAKICSLGYVVADEYFNILEKDDLVINPNIERKDYSAYVMKNIVKYTIEELESKETFPFFYEKIKNLLENEDHVVVGYDVSNDIRDLMDECERYELPLLKIISYDTQKIYKEYMNDKNFISLGNLMKKFNLDINAFTEHNSRDDAEMTLLVTKAICKELNYDITYLFEKYKKTTINYLNYKNRSLKTPKRKYLVKVKQLNDKLDHETIKICFSHSLNIDKIDEKLNLIDKMYEKGYSYVSSLTKCDYFIEGNKKDKLDEACDYIIINGIKDIKKISMKEFLLMLKKENKKIKSR